MNPQTTITGLVTAIAALLSHFNIIIPQEWQNIIIAVGIAVLGFFTADAKTVNKGQQ